MQRESRVPADALLLVVATGVATTARAMTLSFLATVLQQKFGLGPATIGFLLGHGSLMGAIAAPLIGALSDKVGRIVRRQNIWRKWRLELAECRPLTARTPKVVRL